MLEPRQLVLSVAGRDKGQLLAVVRQDEHGVWLADGKRRPLERPKCKNPRHIRPLKQTLDGKAMTTDRALRRALRQATGRFAENDA
ncbi:MAG: KOW domain-containing RNA-binding protein [Clostridia bacterium]|nr:KOW domain-containing RNA-binding protein [Clostridia bacterium]